MAGDKHGKPGHPFKIEVAIILPATLYRLALHASVLASVINDFHFPQRVKYSRLGPPSSIAGSFSNSIFIAESKSKLDFLKNDVLS